MAATFFDHLIELKTRIIKIVLAITTGSAAGYFYFDKIIRLFLKPFEKITGQNAPTLYMNSLFEGFMMRMHFAIIFGIVLALPIIVYQILRFILPGLKPRERKIILSSIISATILALTGVILVYTYLLPYSIGVLTSHEFVPQNIGILLNYQESVFYIFNFLVGAMIIFQFPIILMILMYLKLITRLQLFQASRFVIILIFIISAIVTPPDIVSQIGIATPMVVLFYGTILVAKVLKIGDS